MDDDAGTGGGDNTPDAAIEAADESNGTLACGVKSCNQGEYCCDGLCGACAPVGTNCPPSPCGDAAPSDDAASGD